MCALLPTCHYYTELSDVVFVVFTGDTVSQGTVQVVPPQVGAACRQSRGHGAGRGAVHRHWGHGVGRGAEDRQWGMG